MRWNGIESAVSALDRRALQSPPEPFAMGAGLTRTVLSLDQHQRAPMVGALLKKTSSSGKLVPFSALLLSETEIAGVGVGRAGSVLQRTQLFCVNIHEWATTWVCVQQRNTEATLQKLILCSVMLFGFRRFGGTKGLQISRSRSVFLNRLRTGCCDLPGAGGQSDWLCWLEPLLPGKVSVRAGVRVSQHPGA
ncbi:hypothetical protein AAFF_G00086010 [Aldrovandia affinis]|uniref:Uncharacterized protein n=1 Tax=Aldrovandia affinis TaxID=143900 RepID=A0AAD7VWY3_9TELE|nr:hypothetical protein AAFF_G00086010 [Aldrovandia affinis]